MNAARRSHKRRDWPRGLREVRPGYFAWDLPNGTRMPDGRQTIALGSIPLAAAKAEAAAANLHLAARKPTLLDQLSGRANTVADAVALMPAGATHNSLKQNRSIDKRIVASIGRLRLSDLDVLACANLLQPLIDEDKLRMADAVRSRMIAVCRKAMARGWMETNPAEATERPKVSVKRGRLTLDLFRAIYAVAPEVNEWLPTAMQLGLLTGADRATIGAMRRTDVVDDCLSLVRGKTGAHIHIPLDLKLDVLGWNLREVVLRRPRVVSQYLVHHAKPYGNAPVGSQVFVDAISKAFRRARVLAGIPDVLPDGKLAPTFHELRSLAKRLYTAQGNVDTKALLAHSTERMSNLYSDPRGAEPVRVRIG